MIATTRLLMLLAPIGLAVVLTPTLAAAPQSSTHADQVARMETALAAPDRPSDDRRYDAARKPVEVIHFLGIEPGMTVLDANSGGGYYTEALAAAVGPTG